MKKDLITCSCPYCKTKHVEANTPRGEKTLTKWIQAHKNACEQKQRTR